MSGVEVWRNISGLAVLTFGCCTKSHPNPTYPKQF